VGSPVLLFDAEQLADIPVIGDGKVGDPVRIAVCFTHRFIIRVKKDQVRGEFVAITVRFRTPVAVVYD